METLTKTVSFICILLYVVAAAPRSLFNSNDINFETYMQQIMCPPCMEVSADCTPTILKNYHIKIEKCQTCMTICQQKQQTISVMDKTLEEEKVRTKRSIFRRRGRRRRIRKLRKYLKPVKKVKPSTVVNIKPNTNINKNKEPIFIPLTNTDKPPLTTTGNVEPGNARTNKANGNVKTNKGNENVMTNKGNGNVRTNKANGNVKTNKENENVRTNKANVNVRTNKANKNVRTNKANGNVRTNKGNGNVGTSKGNGNVRTIQANKNVGTSKANGNVRTNKANGNVGTKKANGNARTNKPNGNVRTNKVNGNVKTNKANGRFKNVNIISFQNTNQQQVSKVPNALSLLKFGSPMGKSQSSDLVSPDMTNGFLTAIMQTVSDMKTNSNTHNIQPQDKIGYTFPASSLSNALYGSVISNAKGMESIFPDKVQTSSVKSANEIHFVPAVGSIHAPQKVEHNNQYKRLDGKIDKLVWSVLHSIDQIHSNANQIKQTDVSSTPIPIEPTKTSKNQVSNNLLVENIVSSVVDAVGVKPTTQSPNKNYDSAFMFEPLKPKESSKTIQDKKKKELHDKKKSKNVVYKQVRNKFPGIMLPSMQIESPSARKPPLSVTKKHRVITKRPQEQFRHNYHENDLPFLSISTSNKNTKPSSTLGQIYSNSRHRKPISHSKNVNNNLVPSTTKSKTKKGHRINSFYGLPVLSINGNVKPLIVKPNLHLSSNKIHKMKEEHNDLHNVKPSLPVLSISTGNVNPSGFKPKLHLSSNKIHKMKEEHNELHNVKPSLPVLAIGTGNVNPSGFKPKLHLSSNKIHKMKEEHNDLHNVKSSYTHGAVIETRKPRKMIKKQNAKLSKKHVKPAQNAYFGLPLMSVSTKKLKPISWTPRKKLDMIENNLQTKSDNGIYHDLAPLTIGVVGHHHSSTVTRKEQKKPKPKSPHQTNLGFPTLPAVSGGFKPPKKFPKKRKHIATNMLQMGPMRRHRGVALSFERSSTRRKMSTKKNRKEKVSRRHAERRNGFIDLPLLMHSAKPLQRRHNTRRRSMPITEPRGNFLGISTTKPGQHNPKTPQKRTNRKNKTRPLDGSRKRFGGLAVPFRSNKQHENKRPAKSLMIRNTGRHHKPLLQKRSRHHGITLPGIESVRTIQGRHSTRFPREQQRPEQYNHPKPNAQYPGMDFVKGERVIDFSPPNFEDETADLSTFDHLLDTDSIVSSVIDAVQGHDEHNSVSGDLLVENDNSHQMIHFTNEASETQKTIEEYIQQEPEINNANVDEFQEIMSKPSTQQLTVATTDHSSNTMKDHSAVGLDTQSIGGVYPTELAANKSLTYKARMSTSPLQQTYERIADNILRMLISEAININDHDQSKSGSSHTNNVSDNDKSINNKNGNSENDNNSIKDYHTDNAYSSDNSNYDSSDKDNSSSEEGDYNPNSSDHNGNDSSDEDYYNDNAKSSDSSDSSDKDDNNSGSEEDDHSDDPNRNNQDYHSDDANSDNRDSDNSGEGDHNDNANSSDSYESNDKDDNNSGSDEDDHSSNAKNSDHDGYHSSGENDHSDYADSSERDNYDNSDEDNNSSNEKGDHIDKSNGSDHDDYGRSNEDDHSDNANSSDQDSNNSSNEDDHSDNANSSDHDGDYSSDDRDYNDNANSNDESYDSTNDDENSSEDANSDTANSNDNDNGKQNKRSTADSDDSSGSDSSSSDSDNDTTRHKRSYDSGSSESGSNSDNSDIDTSRHKRSYDSSSSESGSNSDDSNIDTSRHKRSYDSSSSESGSNSDDSDIDTSRHKRSYDSGSSESGSNSDDSDIDTARHKRSYDSSSSESGSNSDNSDIDTARHKRSYDSGSSESGSNSNDSDYFFYRRKIRRNRWDSSGSDSNDSDFRYYRRRTKRYKRNDHDSNINSNAANGNGH